MVKDVNLQLLFRSWNLMPSVLIKSQVLSLSVYSGPYGLLAEHFYVLFFTCISCKYIFLFLIDVCRFLTWDLPNIRDLDCLETGGLSTVHMVEFCLVVLSGKGLLGPSWLKSKRLWRKSWSFRRPRRSNQRAKYWVKKAYVC